jgi:hypothetical protein
MEALLIHTAGRPSKWSARQSIQRYRYPCITQWHVLQGSTGIPKLSSITIRGGNRIDGISYTVQCSSGSTTTTSHGGSSGTAYTISLGVNERVVEAYVCSGSTGHDACLLPEAHDEPWADTCYREDNERLCGYWRAQ